MTGPQRIGAVLDDIFDLTHHRIRPNPQEDDPMTPIRLVAEQPGVTSEPSPCGNSHEGVIV